ncbi:Unknown protein sequence [Pseudomonas coronafaciens pv. oryzae]|nr:Unknown protein sequence [Pseudomonas coronafaciens pv. oryzae]
MTPSASFADCIHFCSMNIFDIDARVFRQLLVTNIPFGIPARAVRYLL